MENWLLVLRFVLHEMQRPFIRRAVLARTGRPHSRQVTSSDIDCPAIRRSHRVHAAFSCCRTVSTGHSARRTTFSPTEPNTRRPIPVDSVGAEDDQADAFD